MNDIITGAQTFSTYGLYAVSVALVAVVIFLYKKVNELEKELRTTIKQNADDNNKIHVQMASENARLIAQTSEALKDNTKAFIDFQEALNSLKVTVQMLLERVKG